MKIMKRLNLSKLNLSKFVPFFILFIILSIIIYNNYRKIHIFILFLLYDIKTFFGNLWKIDPCYGSYMKSEFTTKIPLSFYKDFNYAISKRVFTSDNDDNIDGVRKCCDAILKYINENNIPEAEPKQLPIVSMNDNNCKEKVLYYIDNNIPFVLRDSELEVFENMKYDKIIELFGDDKVLFSPSLPHCKESKMDYLKNIEENKCYVSNISSIFNKYDKLLTDSDISKISNLSNGTLDSKQLFTGVTKGSGTALHNAYTNNFFINIEGEKTWTFINPNNTPLLYPYFSKSGVYGTSESRFLNHKVSDISKFPLLKYCDYYEYTIKPGEILYNPASWWHSVYNNTETTVAISTRWSFPNYYSKMLDYHLLRCGNLSNKGLRELVEKLYIEYGIFGISLIDEHNVLGDENNDIPVWDNITNESHNLCIEDNCHLRWHSYNEDNK